MSRDVRGTIPEASIGDTCDTLELFVSVRRGETIGTALFKVHTARDDRAYQSVEFVPFCIETALGPGGREFFEFDDESKETLRFTNADAIEAIASLLGMAN